VLTTFGLDEYVYEALHAGASGFVLKDDPPEQVIAAVRTIAAETRCCLRRSPRR
jgi:DNA-binding NarL/FixJ family response regulator